MAPKGQGDKPKLSGKADPLNRRPWNPNGPAQCPHARQGTPSQKSKNNESQE